MAEIFTAKIWKTHRKFLNPCFNPKLLQSFLPIFDKKCRTMTDRLASKLNSREEFDAYSVVGKCTLDMICGTAMGLECDFQTPEGDHYLESAEIVAESVNKRIFNILLHPNRFYQLTSLFREEQHAWRGMRRITAKVINAFKAQQRQNEGTDLNNNEAKDTTDELRKPRIFVDQVYEMARTIDEFDDQSITDEIDTLIAGVSVSFFGEFTVSASLLPSFLL